LESTAVTMSDQYAILAKSQKIFRIYVFYVRGKH